MLTWVEFRSDLFPPEPGEDEMVNPGLYGKRLAEFLVAGLRRAGFDCQQPFPEDWGWHIDVSNDVFPLWIGCGHQYGPSDQFLCFIEPHKPEIRKFFKKINTRPAVEALQRGIADLLAAEPGITEVQWSTNER
jgi:hypothetical protein